MKILTLVVFVLSVIMMGFGIYMMVYSDDTKAIKDLYEDDIKERPPCYSVFPAYIHFLGILGIIVSFMGIPAFFGNKIHDQGAILILLTIFSMWLIVVALHVTTLGNFEDADHLAMKKKLQMSELIRIRTVTVNASANAKNKMEAFNQLAKIKEIETLNYCCGVDGAEGYTKAGYPIPTSCCKVKDCDVNVEKNLYSSGCYEYLKTHVFIKNEDSKNTEFPIKVMTRNLSIQIIFTLINYALIFFSRIWPDGNETAVDQPEEQ